jgi:uncharacterized protein YbjQ (UPF0145 family)
VSTDIAAGWYPDPQDESNVRYWDGSAWTEHVQPANPTAEPTAVEAAPAPGSRRLEQMKGGLFTTGLPVDELLLIKEAGFEPLGIVIGSSVHQIGFQQSEWSHTQEMGPLSQAMYRARELAMSRMQEEAGQLGADGVLSVRLDVGEYEWGPNMAEFVAVGTAVRRREGSLGRPFTSDLSGQELAKLLAGGYRPVGLVMGTCVYHVAYRGLGQFFRQQGANVEMESYTRALRDARELAMERMQYEAQRAEAEGVVGVKLTERSHGWGSHVIEFFAIGTAVAPAG